MTRITASILSFALLGIVWTSYAIDGFSASGGINGSGLSQALVSGPGTTIEATRMNESSYKIFLNMVQGMYREDFNYSGGILENYVNKTISNRDAMEATTSTFILTSHGIALLEANRPPAIYENTYNNTLLGMKYLGAFLWNMAKFYETNRSQYLVQARSNLNDSVSFYKSGQEGLASFKNLTT